MKGEPGVAGKPGRAGDAVSTYHDNNLYTGVNRSSEM